MRKGQVTIFVILGIILLIIIGLFLYVRGQLNDSQQTPPDSVGEDTLDVTSLKLFIENCLNKVGSEGLRRIGASGGYISPEDAGFFSLDDFPYLASAIKPYPEADFIVPYWYYLDSPMTCQECNFRFGYPFLIGAGSTTIQSQLNRYVEQNIDSCINGFSVYDLENFDITKLSSPSAESNFPNGKVSLILKYPLLVSKEGSSSKITNFYTDLPVNFRRIYNVAFGILQDFELSEDYHVFEDFTKKLINYYSMGELDTMLLPPISGPLSLDVSAPKYWLLMDVKDNLQRIIMENIELVQVVGSRDYRSFFDPSDDTANNVYDDFLVSSISVNPIEMANVKVDFDYYSWWPAYVNVGGSGIIMPKSFLNTFIIPIGLTTYDFNYDVSYPVLVRLSDPTAFDGKGYDFQYAIEVNLHNNEPFSRTQINNSFADSLNVIDSSFSLFSQRTSGDIIIKTKDTKTGDFLSDVMVSYVCADQSILVGVTSVQSGQALLKTTLPVCLGGRLVAFKQGYFSDSVVFSTAVNKSQDVTLNITSLSKLNLNVRKRPVVNNVVGFVALDSNWQLQPNVSLFLDPDEYAIVIFEKITLPGEDSFSKVFYVNSTTNDAQSVELVPGQYKLQGLLFLELGENRTREKIVFPGGTYCVDYGLLGLWCDEYKDVDDLELNSTVPVGGVLLDESSGYFNVTSSDLEKSSLYVYVAGMDVDKIIELEDVSQLGAYTDYSKNNRSAFEPVFD